MKSKRKDFLWIGHTAESMRIKADINTIRHKSNKSFLEDLAFAKSLGECLSCTYADKIFII